MLKQIQGNVHSQVARDLAMHIAVGFSILVLLLVLLQLENMKTLRFKGPEFALPWAFEYEYSWYYYYCS